MSKIKVIGMEGFEAKFIKATDDKRTLKVLVPEGYVALSEAELAYLWFSKREEVKKLINDCGYVLTSSWACWLGDSVNFLDFKACNRCVDDNGFLRGVFVKKVK
jgi:hypothetical protein